MRIWSSEVVNADSKVEVDVSASGSGSAEDAVGGAWRWAPPEGSDELSETPHPKQGAAAGADGNVVLANPVALLLAGLTLSPAHRSASGEPADVVGEDDGK